MTPDKSGASLCFDIDKLWFSVYYFGAVGGGGAITGGLISIFERRNEISLSNIDLLYFREWVR